jgi:hypothetical protein
MQKNACCSGRVHALQEAVIAAVIPEEHAHDLNSMLFRKQ